MITQGTMWSNLIILLPVVLGMVSADQESVLADISAADRNQLVTSSTTATSISIALLDRLRLPVPPIEHLISFANFIKI